jgi:hypothetical protein
MVLRIVSTSVLALALAANSIKAAKYTLDPRDIYTGANFFNAWNFITVNSSPHNPTPK